MPLVPGAVPSSCNCHSRDEISSKPSEVIPRQPLYKRKQRQDIVLDLLTISSTRPSRMGTTHRRPDILLVIFDKVSHGNVMRSVVLDAQVVLDSPFDTVVARRVAWRHGGLVGERGRGWLSLLTTRSMRREGVCDVGGVDNGVCRHDTTVSVLRRRPNDNLRSPCCLKKRTGVVWRWGQGEGGACRAI